MILQFVYRTYLVQKFRSAFDMYSSPPPHSLMLGSYSGNFNHLSSNISSPQIDLVVVMFDKSTEGWFSHSRVSPDHSPMSC